MSTTNPLWYKVPKYVLLKNKTDYDQVYKVIGYHHTIDKFKLQLAGDLSCFYASPEEVLPISDPELLKELKRLYG